MHERNWKKDIKKLDEGCFRLTWPRVQSLMIFCILDSKKNYPLTFCLLPLMFLSSEDWLSYLQTDKHSHQPNGILWKEKLIDSGVKSINGMDGNHESAYNNNQGIKFKCKCGRTKMDLERVVHRWSPSQRIIVELISNTEMLSDPTIQLSNYCVLTRKFIKVIKLVGRGRQIEVVRGSLVFAMVNFRNSMMKKLILFLSLTNGLGWMMIKMIMEGLKSKAVRCECEG